MSCEVATDNLSATSLTKEASQNGTEQNGDSLMVTIDQLDDDASTIINVSILKKEKSKIDRNLKLDVESCADSNETLAHETQTAEKNTDSPVDRVDKVVGWLESHEEIGNGKVDLLNDDLFLSDDSSDNLVTTYIENNVRRVNVFLLDVEPSVDIEPLDLVSGYCYGGCKKFSTFSLILWSQQDGYDIPLCHHCSKTDIKEEVKLMFKFKLRVMDANGLHEYLHVWKEHGEKFLGCTTEKFIRESCVREAAVAPLKQNTVANTINADFTPLLDLGLVCIKDLIFVVKSKLKKHLMKDANQ